MKSTPYKKQLKKKKSGLKRSIRGNEVSRMSSHRVAIKLTTISKIQLFQLILHSHRN